MKYLKSVLIVVILLFSVGFVNADCSDSEDRTLFVFGESSFLDALNQRREGTADPAAIYCNQMGYNYKIVEDNGQRGVCIMPNKEECDEWDFYKGKCGEEYSYCTVNGYELRTEDDGKDPFSVEYAVCYDDGEKIGSVTELAGIGDEAVKSRTKIFNFDNKRKDKSGDATMDSFDWRDHNGENWMTSVKAQGMCGSCWAFAAVGATEAMYNIKSGYSHLDLDLSEQYLVSDCTTFSGDCCVGYGNRALRYIRDWGIPDENCMWYVDGFGCSCEGETCDSNCDYSGSGICSDTTCNDRCSDWEDRLKTIDSTGKLETVQEIKDNIANVGPVVASMNTLDGGFIGDPAIYRCDNPSGTDHIVVLVGYDDAGEYWIAKNSWGSTWGPDGDGYFKIGYGECLIENYVFNADVTLNPRQRVAVPL